MDFNFNGQYLSNWILSLEVISSASPKPIKSLSLSALVTSFHCLIFSHRSFSCRLSSDQAFHSSAYSISATSASSNTKWIILSRNFENLGWTLNSDHISFFLNDTKKQTCYSIYSSAFLWPIGSTTSIFAIPSLVWEKKLVTFLPKV